MPADQQKLIRGFVNMATKKGKTYYSRLRNVLTLVIALLTTVPMLLVGWAASSYYQKYDEENSANGLIRMVENRKVVINLFLKQQRDLLGSLIKLYDFGQLSQQADLERVFAAIAEKGVIVDLGVIDATGRHIAYVGPYKERLAKINYRHTEWFQEVMVSGSHISDVFSGYRGVPHFVVAVSDPLKTWILRATINSELFNSLLRSAKVDPRGDAFIINSKGEFQTPSLSDGGNNDNMDRFLLLAHHDGTVVRTIGDSVYITSWIKDGSWLFVVKLRRQKMLETFIEARSINQIIIFWASLLIISISIVLVRFLVNSIEAADRKRAALDTEMMQVQKMVSLGRLAAGVAHEVNNPLQMITDQAGWIGELIDEENPENIKHLEEYRQSVNKIKYHVKRASSVTHRLLGFSRKMQAEKAATDINATVQQTVSFLENGARDHGISIDTNLDPSLPMITTDAGQLQQVFLNLLNNSLDAIVKGGAILITTRTEENNIAIDFEDSGPGINPEILGKIFDPFFTTKAPGKGTGLGLAICYTITQNLGGEINVWNREAGGVKFTITLPRENTK